MELTLIDKKQETADVWTFTFEPSSPITWEPGQFLIYQLPHKNEDVRGKMRFFTISSPPFEKYPAITTRIQNEDGSSFKKTLLSMKSGDKIEAKGPDGNFIVEDLNRNYVFIAGGIGITPFHSIIKQLNNDNSLPRITLLYANKNDDILFKKEFDQIQKENKNLNVEYILSPKHIDGSLIEEKVKDITNSLFYVSGPNPMVDSLMQILKELGVFEKGIMQDYFHGYKS